MMKPTGSMRKHYCTFNKKWQKELLTRYGNTVTLMDATYKTTKYSIPLFFVCVKTNANCHCVEPGYKKGHISAVVRAIDSKFATKVHRTMHKRNTVITWKKNLPTFGTFSRGRSHICSMGLSECNGRQAFNCTYPLRHFLLDKALNKICVPTAAPRCLLPSIVIDTPVSLRKTL